MKKWMLYFSRKKSSGIFVPNGNGGFKEYTRPIEGNGSINAIQRHFGYSDEMVFTHFGFDAPQLPISTILIEFFTRNIICVIADRRLSTITKKMVDKAMESFDEEREYSDENINDNLEEGIEARSLSLDFLSRVLEISNPQANGPCYVPKLEIYLYFINGILVSFKWDNPLLPSAKELKKMNPNLFSSLSKVSALYWKDNYDQIYKEVNQQCTALYSLPKALSNPHINLHRTETGGINFHMLLVCHHNKFITQAELEELNHGRYTKIPVFGNNIIKYKLGNFYYYFNEHGNLLKTSSLLD